MKVSDIRIIEGKMNSLANLYNASKKEMDHITVGEKDLAIIKKKGGDMMGLSKDGGIYMFRGYKLVAKNE